MADNQNFENALTTQKSTTTEMMISKQAQQVQVAMLAAKRFPRDEVEAFNRVLRACQRKSLAEQAMYEYPRGGQKVTGPSIRLAEAVAQNWGNLEFGITELEQKDGKSTVEAYAWDLETNTRRSMIFEVAHTRWTKSKGNTALEDPRDVYEMVANQGSRRVRACILAVIPGDVIEAAIEQCEKTMKSGNTEPLIDRIRKMVNAFSENFSVNKAMLEKFIGCSSDAFSENDFVRLRKIYSSLKDGMAKREDYFDLQAGKSDNKLAEEFKQEEAKKEESKKGDEKK